MAVFAPQRRELGELGLARLLETADGPLPEAGEGFYRRFGGLE